MSVLPLLTNDHEEEIALCFHSKSSVCENVNTLVL